MLIAFSDDNWGAYKRGNRWKERDGVSAKILDNVIRFADTLYEFHLHLYVYPFVFHLLFSFLTGLSAAIALRLWLVERRVARIKNDRHLTRTAVILIESGAIYSIFLISLLVTYIIGDFSLYVPFFLVSSFLSWFVEESDWLMVERNCSFLKSL